MTGYHVYRKFNGKKFEGVGPIYCPEGTKWEWLGQMIKDLRNKGYLVRVVKTPFKRGNPFGNTHTVWLYKRKKGT
jgi:hypothetical protein